MKRISLAMAVLLTAVMMIAAGSVWAEPKQGGTVTIIQQSTPRHLNSAIQSGIYTGIPASQIFASPLRFDKNWNPQPYLAESWEVAPDGKSLTLKLVKNATFHDGHPVTSEDVAFSIMTIKNNHPFKSMLAPVETVETPDEHTAIIRMAEPHPAILLAMSPPLCPIIPKHVYGDGQEIKTHPRNADPVGSGPFKFVEYKPGEYIILERYDNFFLKGRPYLDKVIIKIIQDQANRVMAMERKEADLIPFLGNLVDIKRLKNSDMLNVTSDGYSAIGPENWLAFNTLREPFNNPKVRQAISFAIDRDFIVNKLHAGLSKRSTGPIVPGSPYYNGEVEPYAVDLDKANKNLDDAGYPKKNDSIRFTMTLDYQPNEPEQQKLIAEYLKSQLKSIGVEVNLRPSPDFPTWTSRVGNWDFDASMDIVFNWGDPVIGVHRTYVSSNIRKGVIWSNTQNYNSPKIDELLQKAGTEPDMEKRKALYGEFQKIVVDDCPIAYINVIPYHTIYNKNLKNVVSSCWGILSPLDTVYWEE